MKYSVKVQSLQLAAFVRTENGTEQRHTENHLVADCSYVTSQRGLHTAWRVLRNHNVKKATLRTKFDRVCLDFQKWLFLLILFKLLAEHYSNEGKKSAIVDKLADAALW